MTDCQVICHQCLNADTGRAKRWHWLCEMCAENCLDDHRATTGHTDIELRVTREISAEVFHTRISKAANRWWGRL